MIVGSHVSTRNGYRGAAEYAVSVGGDAFQYFPKNPRMLQPKAFDRKDAQRCAEWCAERGVRSIAHGPYPVNPASEGETAKKMALCTLNDLQIAEACGSIGVVVHFGIYKGKDPLQGYKNMIRWLDDVLSLWEGRALVLLENQAGDHGPMGTTPEELTQIRSMASRPEKIGFCLDTCHLYASGEWKPGGWAGFAERARKLGFWDHAKAIHLNDSRYPSGSRKDRHAALGEGCIGAGQFAELFATPELKSMPYFLETPAGPDGSHGEQIRLARELAGEATP